MKYKMSVGGHLYRILNIVLLSFIVNSFLLLRFMHLDFLHFVCILVFILINIFPSLSKKGYPSFRLRMCSHGSELLIYFSAVCVISLVFHITAIFWCDAWWKWGLSVLIAAVYLSILFWHGIIAVYCTSLQLGIRLRVIGILCGWIPIVHLFVLAHIIGTTTKEVNREIARTALDRSRADEKICATRYPVLLVHGVFFRDFEHLNYWGRIPKALEINGATIYYGNHQSAASVEDSAKELAERIEQIVRETGCEKLNIIAHSKGGLDCRYALARYGSDKYVASLTTINTPHRGCGFADYLLQKTPPDVRDKIAATYNQAAKKLGDTTPDFLAAVSCLTASYCTEFNQNIPDMPSVRYASVGSKLNKATNGKFPLSFSYPLVHYFDGANDGLVSEKSFPWGENYTFVTVKGRRGISHGDMIDLNREDFKGFDVREFYVQLVAELKRSGL